MSGSLAPSPAVPARFASTFPGCAIASRNADMPNRTDEPRLAEPVSVLDLRLPRPAETPMERIAALRAAGSVLIAAGHAAGQMLQERRRRDPRGYFAAMRALRAPRVQGWARRAPRARARRDAGRCRARVGSDSDPGGEPEPPRAVRLSLGVGL